jgi:NAD(P)-dependent dehydrogenase (short-subunit alcohol dehydrogenase family)
VRRYLSAMNSVNGRVAFITGGARGVGKEVARRLHAKGAKLVLTDLDEAALKEFATDLDDDRVEAVVADVRDFAAMQAAVDRAVDRFGGVDIVIANAGISTYGSVLQVDPAAVKTLIDVNVVGVFHTVRAALPSVIDRRGYVLIVSSLAGYAALPGLAPYNAAKAAVEHFANALRMEVAHRGVAVGSAHMSWIDTPLVREGKTDLLTFHEMLSKLPVPLNRTTSVEECGEAFVKGIEGRNRQINCPGWVGLFRWLKPVLSSALGEAPILRFVPDLLPRMDAEVAALGRSMSARTEALENRPTRQRLT